jgi:hypothetical protein
LLRDRELGVDGERVFERIARVYRALNRPAPRRARLRHLVVMQAERAAAKGIHSHRVCACWRILQNDDLVLAIRGGIHAGITMNVTPVAGS